MNRVPSIQHAAKGKKLTGGASRRPRLAGGVRARNHAWFFPCREARPVGGELQFFLEGAIKQSGLAVRVIPGHVNVNLLEKKSNNKNNTLIKYILSI